MNSTTGIRTQPIRILSAPPPTAGLWCQVIFVVTESANQVLFLFFIAINITTNGTNKVVFPITEITIHFVFFNYCGVFVNFVITNYALNYHRDSKSKFLYNLFQILKLLIDMTDKNYLFLTHKKTFRRSY